MSRITKGRITKGAAVGSIMALSLAASVGTAAAGSGKSDQLAHTHLTLKATHSKVTKNDKFKAGVVAKLRAHKAPLAGEAVELYQRDKGATKWVDTGIGSTTAPDGTASFTFLQSESKQQYRVVFAGDGTYQRSHSGSITIHKTKAVHGSDDQSGS
jgi:hypothetical protein